MIGAATAPIRSTATVSTTNSRQFGSWNATRSPRRTPSPSSIAAARSASASSCAHVRCPVASSRASTTAVSLGRSAAHRRTHCGPVTSAASSIAAGPAMVRARAARAVRPAGRWGAGRRSRPSSTRMSSPKVVMDCRYSG